MFEIFRIFFISVTWKQTYGASNCLNLGLAYINLGVIGEDIFLEEMTKKRSLVNLRAKLNFFLSMALVVREPRQNLSSDPWAKNGWEPLVYGIRKVRFWRSTQRTQTHNRQVADQGRLPTEIVTE